MMENKPFYYSQNDTRWKYRMYSCIDDPSQTIGSSGCGPTCAAMVIRTVRGVDVTPVDTAVWSVAHGYRTISQGTEWSYFVPQLAQYGIKSKQTFVLAEAMDALTEGKMVIGRAKKGLWTSSGHYILAWKVEGNTIYVNDPNSTLQRKSVAPLTNWKNEVTPFWIVEETGEENKMTGKQIDAELTTYRLSLPVEAYASESCKKAVACGLFADGDGDKSLDYPRQFLQREELAKVLDRMGLLDEGAVEKLKQLLKTI